MMDEMKLVEDLAALAGDIQPDSIISRTFHKTESVRAILFGFGPDQALTEHTASQAAIIHVIRGEAAVTLGNDQHTLTAGAWIYMPPRLPHSVTARTELLMVLYMFGPA